MNSNLSTLIALIHEKASEVVGIEHCYPSIVFDTEDTKHDFYFQVTIKWGARTLAVSKRALSPIGAAEDVLEKLNIILYENKL